ncbi:thioredoxin [Thioflavicoccus mobilis 8321]|uniref:Thioredoxin n=1 Tax=Thioflavicoccus mobilis 8321 TaxID=765912 RepID=L0H0H1_9GAMM|nr:thioredoxin [Thioflavicoccus mobilis]AGA91084.1 thioredoxin [Thioflavicoccus mobilis 8321]
MADSPFIVTATAQTFTQAVVETSHRVPVLVDFWADWCAPCKALMPILAKLADEYGGKFILAKVDTEAERELAAYFDIRSLPTVQLFKDGQPVDQFMGALPEAQIREFLDRHIPRESDGVLERAEELLHAGRPEEAAAAIAEARENDPDNPRLHLAEVRLKAASGDTAGAEALLERVPLELAHDPEVAALRGELRFSGIVADAPSAEALRERLAADPKDSEARYQLAARYVIAGDYEGALDELLQLLKSDRAWGDDAARKAMVMIFDLLGGQGELVKRYRGRMTAALY